MNITPDQAGDLLPGITPGPWEIHPDHGTVEPDVIGGEGCRFEASDTDLDLIAAAPDLAQTIAGMTEQWRHEAWHDRGDGIGPWRSLCWPHDDGWRNTRESADFDLAQAEGTFKHRLVRRLAGPVEVVE